MTHLAHFPPPGRWSRVLALLAAVLAMGSVSGARAEAGSATFAEANRAFAQGRYPDAVAGFESLVSVRGYSAPLLYDLANAYQREGSVGRAILNYRRAQLLAPRDPDLAANLSFVRAAAGLPAPTAHFYQAAARLLTPTAWTWLAASELWLAAVALGIAALRRQWRPYLYPAALTAFLVALPAFTAAAVLDRACDEAVIVASRSASLRLAPFDTAAIEATVAEGQSVAIVAGHGDFVRIRDGQGRAGWVESGSVVPIVPRHS